MRKKICGAERPAEWSKKCLKLRLAVLSLSAPLLLLWSRQAFSHPFEEYFGYYCRVYFHLVSEDEFTNDKWLKLPSDLSKNKKHCILWFYYGNPCYYSYFKEFLPDVIVSDDPHFQIYVCKKKEDGHLYEYVWQLVKKVKKPVVIMPPNIPYPVPPELEPPLRRRAKPVIYLYPKAETEVTVRLDYQDRLTCTYPAPDGAWRVTARPDGPLTDKQGREYSYLFWEGAFDGNPPDFSRGFVVRGSDTAAFLREKLAYMGLTPREYNEFIVYWLSRMQDNPWNLIAFQGKNYIDSAPLTVTSRPDSVLRVFMAYRPLNAPVSVPQQELKPFVRRGFTLVEWGGQGPDGAVR